MDKKKTPNDFPVVKRCNRKLLTGFLALTTFGLMLPLLMLPLFLPGLPWLTNSYPWRFLNAVVPSAKKLSLSIQSPNTADVYWIFILLASLLLGIYQFLSLKTPEEFLRADMILSSPKSRFRMWLKAVGGSFIFALLIIFFHILPGELGLDPGGSRGQLVVSLMLMSNVALAIFGGLISGSLSVVWFFFLYAVYSVIRIPFLVVNQPQEENAA